MRRHIDTGGNQHKGRELVMPPPFVLLLRNFGQPTATMYPDMLLVVVSSEIELAICTRSVVFARCENPSTPATRAAHATTSAARLRLLIVNMNRASNGPASD